MVPRKRPNYLMGCDERRNKWKRMNEGRESKGGISLEAWLEDWPIPYPSFIVGESEDQRDPEVTE